MKTESIDNSNVKTIFINVFQFSFQLILIFKETVDFPYSLS